MHECECTPSSPSWIDRPTLRLDDAGRAAAARRIKRGGEDTDPRGYRPPPEWRRQ